MGHRSMNVSPQFSLKHINHLHANMRHDLLCRLPWSYEVCDCTQNLLFPCSSECDILVQWIPKLTKFAKSDRLWYLSHSLNTECCKESHNYCSGSWRNSHFFLYQEYSCFILLRVVKKMRKRACMYHSIASDASLGV
jgi:hypothetical protein